MARSFPGFPATLNRLPKTSFRRHLEDESVAWLDAPAERYPEVQLQP